MFTRERSRSSSRRRASLPFVIFMSILSLAMLVPVAGYISSLKLTRSEPGDIGSPIESIDIATAEPAAGSEALPPNEDESLDMIIFLPDEGAIPPLTAKNPTYPAEYEKLLSLTIESSMKVKNNKNLSFDADALLKRKLSFDIERDAILIIHSHGSEAYNGYDFCYTGGKYPNSEDTSKNIVAVGELAAKLLTERGFKVYHDKTLCDIPDYGSSYAKALRVIEENIEKHPEIAMVLDFHRDSLESSDGTKYRLACEIDGNACAQLLFVVGSNKLLEHDGWQSNLAFALKLQEGIMAKHTNLVRPITVSQNRYNQHKTPLSLIVEVGTDGNTLTEALRSSRLFAQALADIMQNAELFQ